MLFWNTRKSWCTYFYMILHMCLLSVTVASIEAHDRNTRDTNESTLRNSEPERSSKRTGVTFTPWSAVLFLSAGLLLLICAVFNLLRYLNDWLARHGIVAIKTRPNIIQTEGVNLPSYTECITPPPTYDDATLTTTRQQGFVPFLPSSFLPLPPYSEIPSDDTNRDPDDSEPHEEGTNENENSVSAPDIASTTV